MPRRAVSCLVWSFAYWTWSRGWLRCLRAILPEMPFLPMIITSPSLFTWVLLGLFLRLFQSRSSRHCWGFSLLPGSYFIYLFFASYFPPHILYHTIPSEPAVTVFLNTNLFQKPVFITYGRYLEPTEWQIYLLRLLLLLNFWDQYQQTCEELPVVYLGIYQEFPSLPVLCQPT